MFDATAGLFVKKFIVISIAIDVPLRISSTRS